MDLEARSVAEVIARLTRQADDSAAEVKSTKMALSAAMLMVSDAVGEAEEKGTALQAANAACMQLEQRITLLEADNAALRMEAQAEVRKRADAISPSYDAQFAAITNMVQSVSNSVNSLILTEATEDNAIFEFDIVRDGGDLIRSVKARQVNS